jgi:hypothetical protein
MVPFVCFSLVVCLAVFVREGRMLRPIADERFILTGRQSTPVEWMIFLLLIMTALCPFRRLGQNGLADQKKI